MDHEAWTAAQSETTVSVDGHDLSVAYYEDAPDAGSDEPPVVFVHGIPTWSYLWRDVATAVAEDRRVVVPDMVGYGNSAMHEGFDRSIRAQEQMLADLVDQVADGEVALVAHDIGGGVALRYAAHHPDQVSELVVSNGVCYDSWPVDFVSNLGLPSTAAAPHDEVMGKLEGAFTQGLLTDDPDPAFVEGMLYPWDSEEGQTSLSRDAVSTNTNHTQEIPYEDISADLLCLWGKDDVMQPLEYGERLADDVGGEVVEIPGYHWVVEDSTETYVEELRSFLTESHR